MRYKRNCFELLQDSRDHGLVTASAMLSLGEVEGGEMIAGIYSPHIVNSPLTRRKQSQLHALRDWVVTETVVDQLACSGGGRLEVHPEVSTIGITSISGHCDLKYLYPTQANFQKRFDAERGVC
jgi:hypothetical protein